MYQDDIKLSAKNLKDIGDPNTDNEDIQSGYRDRIWYRKMCNANNEKPKSANDGINRTTKSRKYQDVQRQGNLQIFRNIGSGYHQTSEDERKN